MSDLANISNMIKVKDLDNKHSEVVQSSRNTLTKNSSITAVEDLSHDVDRIRENFVVVELPNKPH